jgi:hypothetical protein
VVVAVVRVRGIGLALPRAAPGTLHPGADRPIFRRLVGMHTACPLSRAGKSSYDQGHGAPISRNFFLFDRPPTGTVPCALDPLVVPRKAPLRGYRPAGEGAGRAARAWNYAEPVSASKLPATAGSSR